MGLYEGTPIDMEYTVDKEQQYKDDNQLMHLLNFVRDRKIAVPFTEECEAGVTYLEHLKTTIQQHVSDEEILNKIYGFLNPIQEEQQQQQQQLLLICVRRFIETVKFYFYC